MLICPGGGYYKVSDREAEPIAMQFLARGYHAALLRYSVSPVRYPEALVQLADAVRYLRENGIASALIRIGLSCRAPRRAATWRPAWACSGKGSFSPGFWIRTVRRFGPMA